MNKSRLTEGDPLSIIIKFTLPLLIGNVFQQLYNMADTIIVGQFVGQNALAAVGSTGTIMFLIQGLANGFSSGFTVMTSQRFGAEDKEGTRRSVSNALIMSTVVILILTIVSTSSMHAILNLLNTPKEIYQYAYDYIFVICAGLFCTVYYNLFAALLRAVGNSRVPLIFLVFSACLNVGLDLLLIIQFSMGTRGAAVATVVSQGISAILEAVYIFLRLPDLHMPKDFYRMNYKMARSQLVVGLPMALQFGITASGTMILQAGINTYGAIAVASYTAASKVQNLLCQGYMSLGQTMAAYTGQNYGAGKVGRIHGGVRAAMKLDVVYSIIVGCLALLLLRPAMYLFFDAGTNIDRLMPYAWPYMIASVICFIPLGMIFIFRNTMQGAGYGLMPMLGGVVELFCRMAFAVSSMLTGIYILVAMSDASAWVGAGLFTFLAYRKIIRQVDQKFQIERC
ncbi:MATE family efflux transporter [Lachnospiraceae bacterium YH-ros2228]